MNNIDSIFSQKLAKQNKSKTFKASRFERKLEKEHKKKIRELRNRKYQKQDGNKS